ncbi:MAG TPA: hypothetical protein VFW96_07630 [Thermomicrobiales bacterium]|nr:hypothetical protein [Thermomicrobiales bacterium]
MAISSPLDRRRLPVRLPRHRAPAFTATEVRRLLQAPPTDPRARAVRACAARVADWLPPAPDARVYPVRYHAQLPSLVSRFAQGECPAAISRRLSGLATSWGVEAALADACRRIAERLNRDPAAYGAELRSEK